MKVAKDRHPCEIMLREIEAVLEKHSGTLDFEDHCLVISIGDRRMALHDLDNMAHCSCLPRALESEWLVIIGEDGDTD